MPRELSPSEEREFAAYQALGPLEDVRAKLGKLPKVQSEAAEQRKKVTELETENAGLKAKMPEGAVVLTGDEAKAYAAVQQSGKTLKGLNDDLGELDGLRKKDEARTREDAWRKAAKAEDFDPDRAVKALGKLEGFAALPFEVKTETVKDAKGERTDEVGYVTVDGKSVRLAKYLQEHADFLIPGLTNGNGQGKSDAGKRELPEMRGGGAGSRAGPLTEDDYRKSADKTVKYTL